MSTSQEQELPSTPGLFPTLYVDLHPTITEMHEDRDRSSAGLNGFTGRLKNESNGWLPVEEPPQPSSNAIGAPSTSGVRSAETFPQKDELAVTGNGGTQNVLDHPQTSTMSDYANKRSNSWHVIPGRSTRPVSEARSLPTSAFAGGAGTTGPHVNAEDNTQRRSRIIEAQHNLTPERKSRIARDESFNAERISTIIKQEGRNEKEALSVVISELEGLQKVQRSAIKNEVRIQANHAKLLDDFEKSEASYLNSKRNRNIALAALKSETETLDSLRESSRMATERMQGKFTEVDTLRKTLAVDNREREVKLQQLNGSKRSFLRF